MNKLFHDALFIHILRDGRAVVHSILKRREKAGNIYSWWGAKPKNWKKLLHYEPVQQAALQWKYIIETIWEDAKLLGSRYLLVRYEDFVANPTKILQKLFDFIDLDYERVEKELKLHAKEIKDMNWKWRKNLSKEEIDKINECIGEKLAELGYK